MFWDFGCRICSRSCGPVIFVFFWFFFSNFIPICRRLSEALTGCSAWVAVHTESRGIWGLGLRVGGCSLSLSLSVCVMFQLRLFVIFCIVHRAPLLGGKDVETRVDMLKIGWGLKDL